MQVHPLPPPAGDIAMLSVNHYDIDVFLCKGKKFNNIHHQLDSYGLYLR